MKKDIFLILFVITMLSLVACARGFENLDIKAEVVTDETEGLENKEIKKLVSDKNKNSFKDINDGESRQIDEADETKKENKQEENNSNAVGKKDSKSKENTDGEKNTNTKIDETATEIKKTSAPNNNNFSSSKPVTSTNTNKNKKSTASTNKANTSNTTVTTPKPVITTKNETKTQAIDFKTIRQDDNTLEKGKEVVSREGEKGTRTIVYKITYTDGKQTDKAETSNTVTKQPVDKIIKFGTKEAPKKEVILLGEIGNSGKEFDTVDEAVDWANANMFEGENWWDKGYCGWRAGVVFYGYILEDGTKKETRKTYTIIFYEQ